jgi:Ca2+-binding RTX toxin-like protein
MRRNKFNHRKFERLEDRRMMVGDVDLDNGVLEVEGTDDRDMIVFSRRLDNVDGYFVTITNLETNETRTETFGLNEVQRIVIEGEGDNDTIRNFSNLPAELYGNGGDDTLRGGNGTDDLWGGTGNDTYEFSGENLGLDIVHEDANVNADKLDFTNFNGRVSVNLAATVEQVVNTTHLRLRLTSATGIENVTGSRFQDTIYGNARGNELVGLAEIDYLYGRGGADTLRGGDGDDWLYGEAGDDDLFGGANNDRLFGGDNNDDLFGEGGDDNLKGENGLDTLSGGADRDFLDGGFDGLNDILIGGSGQDTFVLHRRRATGAFPTEQNPSDYDSAIDLLMVANH